MPHLSDEWKALCLFIGVSGRNCAPLLVGGDCAPFLVSVGGDCVPLLVSVDENSAPKGRVKAKKVLETADLALSLAHPFHCTLVLSIMEGLCCVGFTLDMQSLPRNAHFSRLTSTPSRHFDICITPSKSQPTAYINTEGS